MLRASKLKAHWLLWCFPTQDPAAVVSFSAVYYHLHAATSALRLQTKQPRLAFVSEKSAPYPNEALGGVRRSIRVAQLASTPKDPTAWRSSAELSRSEEDWDNEDPSDVEQPTTSRDLRPCEKMPEIEMSSGDELVDSDSDYEDTDQEELGQRSCNRITQFL